MIRSRLISFLNKFWFIQFILALLPVLSLILYAYVYMSDLSYAYTVIVHNNEISSINLNTDFMQEVLEFDGDSDKGFTATIQGKPSDTLEVAKDGYICSIALIKKDLYRINYENTFLIVNSHSLIESVEEKDGYFNITVKGNTLKVNSSDTICDIYDSNLSKFKVVLNDETSIELDYIPEIKVLKTINDIRTLELEGNYSFNFSSDNINYVTCLPTDNLYFDKSSAQFVRNISSDFANNFILSSRIYLVLFSMLVLWLLLLLIYRGGKFKVLSRKEPIIINGVAIALTPLLIAITFLIF